MIIILLLVITRFMIKVYKPIDDFEQSFKHYLNSIKKQEHDNEKTNI